MASYFRVLLLLSHVCSRAPRSQPAIDGPRFADPASAESCTHLGERADIGRIGLLLGQRKIIHPGCQVAMYKVDLNNLAQFRNAVRKRFWNGRIQPTCRSSIRARVLGKDAYARRPPLSSEKYRAIRP